jgi:hypothetical protein
MVNDQDDPATPRLENWSSARPMVRADFDARVLGLLRSPDDARGGIQSRLGFLLALNVFLLIVGWLMEIFAAIVVVVPLIVPLGHAFGIHPVHLGIIFVRTWSWDS